MKYHPLSLIAIWLPMLLFSGRTLGYEIDVVTFALLPPHCQGWYAEALQVGMARGIRIDPQAYPFERWRNRIGQPTGYMNHHCNGLRMLSLLEREQEVAILGRGVLTREDALNATRDELTNFLDRSAWSKQNLWLKAEAEWALAKVTLLRGNIERGIEYFEEAIATFPGFWPSSVDLAKLLVETGRYDQATDVLSAAIAASPKVATLKDLLAEVEQRRASEKKVPE